MHEYTCLCVCIHTETDNLPASASAAPGRTLAYIYMIHETYTETYAYIYLHSQTKHARTHARAHTRTHAHTHTHIYIYTHTRIYTFLSTLTNSTYQDQNDFGSRCGTHDASRPATRGCRARLLGTVRGVCAHHVEAGLSRAAARLVCVYTNNVWLRWNSRTRSMAGSVLASVTHRFACASCAQVCLLLPNMSRA